jgi:phosphoribosylformylglycinamidine cyclo-ligase
VLVASTDGVGTKLKVAIAAGHHDTCGVDLVNHCVNDILVQGAKPLFFLDYIAMGRIEPTVVGQILDGFARGCLENRTALLGGETAEMPGLYADRDYDLAGTIVGVVDRAKILDGSRIAAGDVLIGLPSSGLHTNGYSLARKVLFEEMGLSLDSRPTALQGATVGEALLAIHRSYVAPVAPLLEEGLAHAVAHITGGGFLDNIPRVLPKNLTVSIRTGSWPVPPIFEMIAQGGRVPFVEMHRVFNMGIGMVLFVASKELPRVARFFEGVGESWYVIGDVRSGTGEVLLEVTNR